MIIKQPDDDNAIRNLIRILNRLNGIRLSSGDHLIIYMSTLLITPGVMYKDMQSGTEVKLLDILGRILTKSPQNIICVFRTTAPSYFRGRMRKLHLAALDSLRDKCYVKVYDKNLFLNHAKFLIYYYLPPRFMESMYFRAERYFGSTNLTAAGLSGRSGSKKGNYEEFDIWERGGPKSLSYQELERFRYYIKEIMDVIIENYGLYTDKDYLRKYLNDHLEYLRNIVNSTGEIISGTTKGELYEAYVDCQVAYLQTLGLLDSIPGKHLTNSIIAKLIDIMPPPNPFEVEMMLPHDTEHAQNLAEILEFDKNQLILWIKDYLNAINVAIKRLSEIYIRKISRIKELFDEKEINLMEFLLENAETHIKFLKTLLES
ncbi:MAG: hypothetical protein ACP6IQ_07520 [Candidatus Njordarchaeia archaeon]